MVTKCKICGFKVDEKKFKRCPRCNSIVRIQRKCGNCKGCSINCIEKN